MVLIVGLGNPGDEYKQTRHNIGFMVIDAISSKYAIPINSKKYGALFGQGHIEGQKVVLVKPQTYMNRSGGPAISIANYFKINSRDMIVIHDDLDLAFGRLKIKEKGGHGGHKGIISIMSSFGGDTFVRLRIGIGRPESKRSVSDYVLNRFGKDEKESLDELIMLAQEAVVTVVCDGAVDAMNKFNNKQLNLS